MLLVGSHLSGSIGVRSMGEELAARLDENGWRVMLTSAKQGRTARLADMLATMIRRRRDYDLAGVEVYSGLAFFWAEVTSLLLGVLGIPVVLTLHGGRLPQFAERNPRRVKKLLRRAARVTTPSHYLLDSFRAYRRDIEYVPNGIDLSRYFYRVRETPQPRLGWLRSLSHIYRPVDAVLILAELNHDFPELHLRMFGPDKHDGSAEEVFRAIRDHKLEKHVTLAGAVPKTKVPEKLNQVDIFLNTTQYESFGVSVMEAGASGLCIVTSSAGELPYLWHDGVDALLVSPGDTAGYVQAVRRVLLEQDFGRVLSENARKNAEQYDWKRVLPMWEAAFTL